MQQQLVTPKILPSIHQVSGYELKRRRNDTDVTAGTFRRRFQQAMHRDAHTNAFHNTGRLDFDGKVNSFSRPKYIPGTKPSVKEAVMKMAQNSSKKITEGYYVYKHILR